MHCHRRFQCNTIVTLCIFIWIHDALDSVTNLQTAGLEALKHSLMASGFRGVDTGVLIQTCIKKPWN